MSDATLKLTLQEAFKYSDTVTNRGYLADTGMTLRDMLKFDFIKLICFLYEVDGNPTDEIVLITQFFNMPLTKEQFVSLRYDYCMKGDFINSVPRSLTYFVKAELDGGMRRTMKGLTVSRFIVEAFSELGRE